VIDITNHHLELSVHHDSTFSVATVSNDARVARYVGVSALGDYYRMSSCHTPIEISTAMLVLSSPSVQCLWPGRKVLHLPVQERRPAVPLYKNFQSHAAQVRQQPLAEMAVLTARQCKSIGTHIYARRFCCVMVMTIDSRDASSTALPVGATRCEPWRKNRCFRRVLEDIYADGLSGPLNIGFTAIEEPCRSSRIL